MKRFRWSSVVAAAFLLSCLPVLAQPRRENTPSFQVRLGGFFPAAGTDFWKDTEETFTLDGSDFNSGTLGLTVVTPVNNNLEVGVNVDFYEETATSAYRGFVDQDGFSILHDTRLSMAPVSVDFRFLPGGRLAVRGSGGQYRALQPAVYLGGGVGFTYWEYEEVGDFLDFSVDPPEVFFDRFKDDGVAFAAHALAGVELPLGPRTGVLFEGRYTWSEKDLGGPFAGLGTLDLGGASFYGGFAFHF